MVAVSFVLVLALMSSTVVAQPGKNVFTEILACFRLWLTPTPPEIPTESVHRWILLNGKTPTPTSDQDPADIGLSYILQQLNIQPDEFTRRANFTDSFGVTHVYGIPLHQGSLIENLHAAAHIKNGQVFFYSVTTVIVDDHTLTKRSPIIPELTVKMSFEDAVKAAVDCLGVPFYHNISPVKKSYKAYNGNIFVWVFQLRDNPTTQWIEVKVNANTGDIVSKEDVKRDFTYKAIKLPNENAHDGFSKILSPENFQASPNGWTDGYILAGNNVLPGVLNLHIFTATEPNRDSALDNTIIVHELTHGLSDRLTGGAHEDLCMTETESHGLSEGYSDIIAIIFTAKPEDTRNTRRVIGGYIGGDSQGIRRYPYTTDMKVNPLTYQNAVGEKDPYRLGEIWATMLWEVYWNFVEEYGFSENLHDATQEQGNIIFLQLFVGTLMIQPCDPTFASAHHAMLAADDVYYGGIHKYLINEGFAKHGLGSISQLDPTMDSELHDDLYQYGFTEPAGNFQKDNFNRGGIGGDPVIINVQNGKEQNNARFFAPPDGQPGVLNLHIYTATNPNRDPTLDNTLMIHELTHGLSSRLTGGAHEDTCMSKIESRGLSEGYSDMMALIFTAKAEDTRNTKKVIAEYVKGNPGGVQKGNIIFLQLFVGTLMIQPCNPTFESAHDAMLAADDAYYGGIHKHLIRRGFFKRGLDPVSQSDPTTDSSL
ncbi:hypothetical protein BASA50_007330 [Batrachochytrium salamandrivorans]|uniref:Extracellular metalloproteinase n=1 Tax=Batrachochytrium salamandrivorans TaxID=1357716 RepID=A0ABQ8F7B4_9FUNG|nr:hypothetical protein BASA50_007330 [Batrachochytrium salamandrivorans]